jgi:hypothetical protein
MDQIEVVIDSERFPARFESQAAPKTVASIAKLLPLSEKIMHVRWSGEACWIPFGDHDFCVSYENATAYPAPGQFILYPGGVSETEILLAYGGVAFASKAGPLTGNHFMTITDGLDRLADLGRGTLITGQKSIRIQRPG